MPVVYVHLAGEDIDEAHLVLNGMESKTKEEIVKPRNCVRCDSLVSLD